MNIALWAVVPLLSGYVFAVLFPPSAVHVAREDGHKLYFRSAFYGIFLFFCSILINSFLVNVSPRFVCSILSFILYLSEPFSSLISINPKMANLVLLNTICLNLAVLLGLLFNVSKRFKLYIFDKVIKYDDIEVIITRAVRNGMPISLSLKSGKVYVGFIAATIDPKEKRKDIRILPLLSGFRRPDDKTFEFTTNYQRIYRLREDELSHLALDDFEIVFPLSEVQSINLFDLRAYSMFHQADNPTNQLELDFTN
jgi:hypothetical protein